MKRRISIVLDHASGAALQDLERLYRCSASEAVRRALVSHRNAVLGVPEDKRRRRRAAFAALVRLMDGQDVAAEIARLKAEDEGS